MTLDTLTHLQIIDGFLPPETAAAMRAAIDAHFAAPEAHRAETHQVWNYWHVPELYTYLRTTPEKLMAPELVQGFVDALRNWSIEHLGLGAVTWPYLSLYVDGCRQGLHNDAANGRFAFVYSLSCDERKSFGGDTLVLHEGDPFRAGLRQAAAGRSFYQSIEPRFNRLMLFDDRLPHGVSMVEGNMDPVEGRFVLHGHISESGPIVSGALPPDLAAAVAAETVERFAAANQARLQLFHGVVTLKLTISASGRVEVVAPVADRVVQADAGDADWAGLRRRLEAALKALSFPPAAGPTILILPIGIGGPLRQGA